MMALATRGGARRQPHAHTGVVTTAAERLRLFDDRQMVKG